LHQDNLQILLIMVQTNYLKVRGDALEELEQQVRFDSICQRTFTAVTSGDLAFEPERKTLSAMIYTVKIN